jgi:virginiamycin B lyase
MRVRGFQTGAIVVAAVLAGGVLAPAGAVAEGPPPAAAPDTVPSSAWLGLLPDGEVKRRFVLDCTGCHTLHRGIAFTAAERPRSEEEWRTATERMLSFAGATTSFPVISAERDPAATARWLAEHLRAAPPVPARPSPPAGSSVDVYAFPVPQDLPHDLAVLPGGRVLVTGMFTHRMLVLDAHTGAWTAEEIPVPGANPRAVDVGPDGSWYALLGGPKKLARRDPTGAWRTWDLGVYPHSLALDAGGRVWFNGHFTKEPPLVGFVDLAAGTAVTHGAPVDAARSRGGGPIPYGLRVAPGGEVWGTELAGNRLVGLDPATGRFRTFELPAPASGPRRPDFDARGALWVPEYAAGRLGRFDPADGSYRAWDLPLPDALPYVARVDRRRDRVWIGTGAADALLAFDPAGERFTVYPLPGSGCLVRHLDVDEETGDVWAACGQSPGVATSVVRLRPEGPRPAAAGRR